MKNPKQGGRASQHKKKKGRIISSIFLGLFFIVLVVGAYFYYEYSQALKSVKDTEDLTITEEVDFNGVEDEYGKVNILLLGIDARGDEASRTDTIMIAQYNPDTKQSKLVSIMRDSYVDIPGYDQKNKINAAYSFGETELLRKTIKENFDIDLEYYALIDFTGFSKTIDAAFPDGIEMDVEEKMTKGIGMTLEPGLQNLDGDQLLGYVRWRGGKDSDFGRVRRQQETLQKLSSEMTSLKGLTKIPSMIGTIQPYISTNLSNKMLISMATSFLSEENRNIDTMRIPVDNSYTDTTYDHAGMVLDLDIEENKEALQDFLNE